MSFQESTLNKSGEVENIAVAASSGHHNSYPTTFHPLSSDNHRSFLHASSTISSLIVSSLLQNPAAHAAASFAATFWHPAATTEASSAAGSPSSVETPPPSMAAIAAATVAAATAWWAAHGLLPVCTPFYPCTSSPFSFNQPNNGGNGGDKAPPQEKKMNGEKSEKPPGSGNHSDKKSNAEAVVGDDTKEMAPVTEPSKANVRKQVDRSSCGSNTTSSSEIETDALPNHGNGKEKEKEEPKASDVIDSISRRSRSSTISPNESWKEVSEEGRLAFQALFSRQVLPQSFCSVGDDENVSHLDLNREAGESNGKGVDEGLLTMGLGNVKLNIHHTGFKPYKRCSIQDKIVSHQQNDEKGPKRMRLEPDQID